MFVPPEPHSLPLFAPRFLFEGQPFTAENGCSSNRHVSINAGWNLIGNSLCERSVGPRSTGRICALGLKAPDLPGNINTGEFSPAKNYYPSAASAYHEKHCVVHILLLPSNRKFISFPVLTNGAGSEFTVFEANHYTENKQIFACHHHL